MIVFVACPLILWSFFLHKESRWFWFATMTGCLTVVLVAELVAKIVTGHSISQLYWMWSVDHMWEAIITLGLLWFGWTMLLVHLGWKLIRKAWDDYTFKRDHQQLNSTEFKDE